MADRDDLTYLRPTFADRCINEPIPRRRMRERSMEPRVAYQLIRDELQLEGNPTLNMASFVTTTMDEEADRLILENIGKNYIDTEVYRRTMDIEDRCVRILADLYHAPDVSAAWGTVALGSSEALMLGALSHKWRWRQRQQAAGKDTSRPNIVLGNDVHITWDKFALFFDVEPRKIPLHPDRYTITPDEVMACVDENTIAVVGVLGTSYTGQYDPIEEINDALVDLKRRTGLDIPLHVDAASGGFVAPFLRPELRWDFQLEQVNCINVSGHKFGLVYPGVGWAIWRDAADVPRDLFTETNVLGFVERSYNLNFSRGSSMILAQYYNFLRLGRDGYTGVMENLRDTARYLAERLLALERFELVNDLDSVPSVVVRLKDESRYNCADLVARMAQHGWIIPAFTLPPAADHVSVMRMVVKETFSRDMADLLVEDMRAAMLALGDQQTAPVLPRPTQRRPKY